LITKEKSANGIGQLINGIYYSNLLLHLLISVNRFYSVALPLKYGTIFDRKKTKIMVFFIITTAVGFFMGSQFYPGCSYVFDITFYTWSYGESECGQFFAGFEFYFHITLLIIVVAIDIITFRKLLAKKVRFFFTIFNFQESFA
uniref:7TM_GPCR_Srx domain-containing protein n=1 Tax=Dracunculus medinensis TaxID=318479 RepID=A0A0N4UQC6_DRAME